MQEPGHDRSGGVSGGIFGFVCESKIPGSVPWAELSIKWPMHDVSTKLSARAEGGRTDRGNIFEGNLLLL